MIINWQVYPVAILTLILAWLAHNWDVGRLEAKQAAAMASQIQFDITQCQDSKTPTKDSNEHYQDIIAARDARIAELLKRPAKCLYVSRSANNTKGSDGKYGNGNGLPDSILYKYAGFCEAYRGSSETLQQHLDKVRCQLK